MTWQFLVELAGWGAAGYYWHAFHELKRKVTAKNDDATTIQ
jgi:hypothetical protein